MEKFIIFLLICVTTFSELECAPSYCPRYCHCDVYKEFNRADCSAQKLISSSLNIPENVEILDLSKNAITTLDNNCFEGLHHLLNLTLSYNNIHTIYLDAFSPLEKAQFIDLSNNRLEYFDDRIIENNHKLVSLNLAGNKFMSLQNKPLLKSTSLQHLSLRSSQIPHIYPTLFEELPSLLKLDISENLLITLTSIPFNHLQKLKFLDLQKNRWICDRNTESTVKVLKRKNIDVRLDKCNFDAGQTKQMFERMVMLPDSTTETSTKRTKTNIEFVWKNSNILNRNNEAKCYQEDIQVICPLYQSCLISLINYKKLLQQSAANVKPLNSSSSKHFNKEYIFLGIFVGVISTSGFLMSIYLIKKILPKRRNHRSTYLTSQQPIPSMRRRRRRTRTNQAINENSPGNLAPILPPILNRSLSNPERRITSTNHRNRGNFISSLFERPRRQQYRRAINQSTADVIRRLSRSNLLIRSRFSQHFAENSNLSQESEQLVDARNDNRYEENDNTRRNSAMNRDETLPNFTIIRPETPPPDYKDVVPI